MPRKNLPEPQVEKALVGNASDPQQVEEAKLTEKESQLQLLNDYREVEATPQGRRLLLHILDGCSTFKSIWHESPANLSYNSGQQDVGHRLLAEMNEADPMILMRLMELKAKQRRR